MLELLQSKTRREVVSRVARDGEVAVEQISDSDVERVRLVHCHLPMLQEAEVIEVDDGTITPGEKLGQLRKAMRPPMLTYTGP